MKATRYIVTAILSILFGSVPFAAVANGCSHITQTRSAGLQERAHLSQLASAPVRSTAVV
jgi:hypothetical protein